MNEQIQENLAELVDWMKEAGSAGGDLLTEQGPLVAREIILYSRVMSSLMVFLGVALIVVAIVFGRRLYVLIGQWKDNLKSTTEGETTTTSYDVKCAFNGSVSLLFFIWAIVAFVINLNSCIIAWMAPRLCVIEYIKNLL